MEITLLIKSIIGLIVILALLMFLLFLPTNRKKEKTVAKKVHKTPAVSRTDLNYLRSIIKNKRSTTKELKDALELIIKHHGRIHEKLGLRAHPDFDIYMDVLFAICGHPNAKTNIIIKFDRELSRLNPEYKKDISEAITKGLNSRRV